jgi:hypothetical protein
MSVNWPCLATVLFLAVFWGGVIGWGFRLYAEHNRFGRSLTDRSRAVKQHTAMLHDKARSEVAGLARKNGVILIRKAKEGWK